MKWSMMLLAAGALAVAAPAHAQGIPALGAAKAAAQKAANATNANIAEQTGQPVTQRPVNPVNGGASKSVPATATTPAPNAASSKSTVKGTTPAPAAAAPANAAAAKSAPAVTKDTAKKGVTKDTANKATPEVAFSREVFTYEGEGRRDPFLSLLASGDLRPAYNDLKLVAVAYDPTGRKSVAIMRDVSSNDQYRVRVGQTLGRMRVAQIHPKSVTFTIDEFGYSRQEILALGDSTQRKP
jgi:hypothetical protein